MCLLLFYKYIIIMLTLLAVSQIVVLLVEPEGYSQYKYPETPECDNTKMCERGCFKGGNGYCIDKYICIDKDDWGCLATCPESRYNNATDVCSNPEYEQAKKEYDEFHDAHILEIIISMLFVLPIPIIYLLECHKSRRERKKHEERKKREKEHKEWTRRYEVEPGPKDKIREKIKLVLYNRDADTNVEVVTDAEVIPVVMAVEIV